VLGTASLKEMLHIGIEIGRENIRTTTTATSAQKYDHAGKVVLATLHCRNSPAFRLAVSQKAFHVHAHGSGPRVSGATDLTQVFDRDRCIASSTGELPV